MAPFRFGQFDGNQAHSVRQLFNHLVSASEQRGRHCQTERLGGLDIDCHLEFGRRLYRKLGWILALEDAIDVIRRAPELINSVRPVGDQATAGDEDTIRDREFPP